MADIFHCLHVNAPLDDVLRAVTEEELLRPWWGRDEELDVRCLEEPGSTRSSVAWRCLAGPPGWTGTDITFALARDGGATVVRLAHRNWREASDAFARCTTKWASVLLALKSRVETPEGDDLRV